METQKDNKDYTTAHKSSQPTTIQSTGSHINTDHQGLEPIIHQILVTDPILPAANPPKSRRHPIIHQGEEGSLRHLQILLNSLPAYQNTRFGHFTNPFNRLTAHQTKTPDYHNPISYKGLYHNINQLHHQVS